ncbi:MAG TPA: ABC transporter permease, partial [Blastocatellia bacterium]
LPFKDPDRLVMVWENNRPRSRDQNVISPANFLDWQDQSTVFEGMSAFYDRQFNLTGVDDPEEIPAQSVSVNMFPLLGVSPLYGRAFAPEEGKPESEPVVILSHGLWLRRFGGDQSIIGNKIMLNGLSFTVIGVMPPGFKLFVKKGSNTGKPAELWVPIRFTPQARVRSGRFMMALARLGEGVTLEAAQSEMDALAARLEQQYVDFNTGWGINLVPLHTQFSGTMRTSLLVLLGAVGCVLLIACANVANLLLARAAARQKEMAVRSALGARRWRIIRQLLTESVILSAIGGVAGFALAVWGVRALVSLSPDDLIATREASVDFQVLAFTLTVSVLTGLIFGLAPAIASSRVDVNESLKEGGRTSATSGSLLRNALVVVEIAIALVLLVGSGLMIRSFARLQAIDPGFDSTNLLAVKVSLPGPKYTEDHQRVRFFREALGRVRSLPGVRSASAISFLPFAGMGAATGFTVVGRPAPAAGESPVTDVRVIDPDYFRTMGIELLRGREFNEQEATEARHVVIVNEAMVRIYFPDEDPIGKKLVINMMDDPAPSEIIGVVRDVKHQGLDIEPRAMTYWPHPELAYNGMMLVVKAQSGPKNLVAGIQREIQSLDRDQPIADVHTMEELISESVSKTRFSMLLLSIFAGVALVLASVGIYGVMSYSVTQRTHE